MSPWKVVFWKEVRENLRDRRTMFSTFVLGTLMGPVLFAGLIGLMISVTLERAEKPLKLPVAGGEHAPNLIAWLKTRGVEIEPAPADAEAAIRKRDVDVVLRIPAEYAEQWREGRAATLELIVDRSQQKAEQTVSRAERLIAEYASMTVSQRLLVRGISPEVVQPVLFAVEVGLAALWRSWGIEPDAVVGHSMGEVAAAHVAGALTLDDAVRVICRRSRVLRAIAGAGAMAVVVLDAAGAEAAPEGFADRLGVAACNGPRSTVIAGEPTALAEVLARLTAQQVFCRQVKVDVASHSPQVEPLGPALLAALGELRPRATQVAMRSTVTEAEVAGTELTADYWLANVRRPVRFAGTVAGLVAEGFAVFIEMSPHPVLTPAVAELLRAAGGAGLAVGSQRREQDEKVSRFTVASTTRTSSMLLVGGNCRQSDSTTIPSTPERCTSHSAPRRGAPSMTRSRLCIRRRTLSSICFAAMRDALRWCWGPLAQERLSCCAR